MTEHYPRISICQPLTDPQGAPPRAILKGVQVPSSEPFVRLVPGIAQACEWYYLIPAQYFWQWESIRPLESKAIKKSKDAKWEYLSLTDQCLPVNFHFYKCKWYLWSSTRKKIMAGKERHALIPKTSWRPTTCTMSLGAAHEVREVSLQSRNPE